MVEPRANTLVVSKWTTRKMRVIVKEEVNSTALKLVRNASPLGGVHEQQMVRACSWLLLKFRDFYSKTDSVLEDFFSKAGF